MRFSDGNRGRTFYYLVSDLAKPATSLALPENVNPGDVLGLDIGSKYGLEGVAFLYKLGASQSLVFNTFPTATDGPASFNLGPGSAKVPANLRSTYKDLTSVTLAPGIDEQSSDIFVGSKNGVFFIQNSDITTLKVKFSISLFSLLLTLVLQQIGDGVTEVHQVQVRKDDSNISVWAQCSPANLYYIRGTFDTKNKTYQWTTPLLYSPEVLHIAPLRNKAKQANEVYAVQQDGGVVHHWQDPISTAWQQRPVSVSALNNFIVNFTSYTTHIHLEVPDGGPLPDKPYSVQLTSSDWLYVTINGKVYSVDHDTPATVPFDAQGNITIVALSDNLATPAFYIKSDFLPQPIGIYANARVLNRIKASSTSADALRGARDQYGRPVLTQDYDDSTAVACATAVHTIVTSNNNSHLVDPKV